MSCSASPKAGDDGEILVKHRLQFSDSLKDLKQLREQLYSAADYFESSYNRDSRKQFVVDSSKDYVAKALVNTVDHLGSVADKLNKFLEKNAKEYSATNTKFSCIEQRLCMIESLVDYRGLSQHLCTTKDCGNYKHSVLPYVEASILPLDKSYVLYRNRISTEPDDVKQDNSILKTFQATKRMKKPVTRKEDSRREAFPNLPQSFSFTNKEAERRSVSPLRLPFNLLINRRSVSPSPSMNKGQQRKQPALEPRRAMSAYRRRETSSNIREIEIESYTRKSTHLLKALFSIHQSRKAILNKH